jgi:hypothetical protein
LRYHNIVVGRVVRGGDGDDRILATSATRDAESFSKFFIAGDAAGVSVGIREC